MCRTPFFTRVFTLVGGNWGNVSNAGLWYWNVNEASSNAWTTVGARLLIKNIINIRDMVCRARLYLALFTLVGGRWIEATGGLWYWYIEWTGVSAGTNVGARPLISGFGVFCTDFVFCVSALVGGAWNNAVNAGLWYWNVNWTGTD